MRLKSFLLLGLAAATAFCGEVLAKEAQPPVKPAQEQPAAPAQPPPAQPKTPEEALLVQLDGTQWSLKLTPSSSAKDQTPVKDTVSFTGRKVTSAFLSKTGYPSSNISLSIGGDGSGVWETMQTKEGEGVAFWRGEIAGSTMRGVLSKHPVEGKPEDYSFSGQLMGGKPISTPSTQSAAQPQAVQAASPAESSEKAAVSPSGSKTSGTPPVSPPENTDKKKKKRWF